MNRLPLARIDYPAVNEWIVSISFAVGSVPKAETLRMSVAIPKASDLVLAVCALFCVLEEFPVFFF